MKTVIFGGTGFIGAQLAKMFSSKGFDVTVASFERKLGTASVDVATGKGFKKLPRTVDVVFNMASLIHSRNPCDPRFMRVNAVGAGKVAEYARETGAWLVHSSSASIYGKPKRLPVKESAEKHPLSEYARSKLESEKFCESEIGGDRLTILRYSSVFGPGQVTNSVLPVFLGNAVRGESLNVIDPERTQDFVFVDDVARANLHFFLKKANGVYNIGSGIETSMLSLARVIVGVTRSKSEVVIDDSGSKSGFRMKLDVSRAKRTGFLPKTSLANGLRLTAESMAESMA